VRLEPLSGDQYSLSCHHHTGRWEPTPFTGDVAHLARFVMTEFGAYLDSYDFLPTKSGMANRLRFGCGYQTASPLVQERPHRSEFRRQLGKTDHLPAG
jgi:hypothetical protein